MSFAAILLIALGLSADAFAASLARGAAARPGSVVSILGTAALFGTSEAAMPLLGYALASQFAEQVTGVDHWIALLLLGAVGAHMIREGLGGNAGNGDPEPAHRRSLAGSIATAIGTSIDAAAVGVALAFVAVEIWTAVAVIGAVSFLMSALGQLIGRKVGRYLGRHAEIAGGTVLVGIGGYIFYTHVSAG